MVDSGCGVSSCCRAASRLCASEYDEHNERLTPRKFALPSQTSSSRRRAQRRLRGGPATAQLSMQICKDSTEIGAPAERATARTRCRGAGCCRFLRAQSSSERTRAHTPAARGPRQTRPLHARKPGATAAASYCSTHASKRASTRRRRLPLPLRRTNALAQRI